MVTKSLHQRLKDYEEARARIFHEEVLEKKKTCRKYRKIRKLRETAKVMKRVKQTIVSSIITMSGDKRLYAKTKVDGEEVVALLDSGAGANCIGKNAMEFLARRRAKIIAIRNQNIKTANGSETAVTGTITLPVEWEGKVRDMQFLIVPDLHQQMYFGIDFWRVFELCLVSPSETDKVAVDVLSEGEKVEEVCIEADQHELSEDEVKKLQDIKAMFPSFEILGLGRTDLEEHVIEIENEKVPIKQRHYPISPVKQEALYKQLDRMLENAVIEESNSSWSSPMTLVQKTGKDRACLDARKVNERMVKDAYPLPHIEGILSRLQDTQYISAIDLKDAFWQIPLEKESRKFTAFTVPGRPLYQFTVMPFGLCNAAQRMCRLMDKVIPARIREFFFCVSGRPLSMLSRL